ncbi:hypothetical protein D9M72_462500 [compost metagenome]
MLGEVVDQAGERRELGVDAAVARGAGSGGVLARADVPPAQAAAQDQRDRIDDREACVAVDTILLGGGLGARSGKAEYRLDEVAARVVDIDHLRERRGRIARVAARRIRVVEADQRLVAAPEQRERAVGVHVEAGLLLRGMRSRGEQRRGVDARDHRRIGIGLLAMQAVVEVAQRALDLPAAVELVLQLGKGRGGVEVVAVPVSAQVGGARHIQQARLARDRIVEGRQRPWLAALGVLVAGAHRHHGAGRDVVLDHAIERTGAHISLVDE